MGKLCSRCTTIACRRPSGGWCQWCGRPVVEHASTVWCTTAAAQQARLEQVQTRVPRRIVRLPVAVADDVLRMELGCRPYASSWMDQRKLEFAFRLATMAANRLPARVASACWPRLARKGGPALRAAVVAALERAVAVDVAPLAAAVTPKAPKAAGDASARPGCARHEAPCETSGCCPLAGARRTHPAHQPPPAVSW
jgi:hypothetical protein